jgi:hypothetical protein
LAFCLLDFEKHNINPSTKREGGTKNRNPAQNINIKKPKMISIPLSSIINSATLNGTAKKTVNTILSF